MSRRTGRNRWVEVEVSPARWGPHMRDGLAAYGPRPRPTVRSGLYCRLRSRWQRLDACRYAWPVLGSTLPRSSVEKALRVRHRSDAGGPHAGRAPARGVNSGRMGTSVYTWQLTHGIKDRLTVENGHHEVTSRPLGWGPASSRRARGHRTSRGVQGSAFDHTAAGRRCPRGSRTCVVRLGKRLEQRASGGWLSPTVCGRCRCPERRSGTANRSHRASQPYRRFALRRQHKGVRHQHGTRTSRDARAHLRQQGAWLLCVVAVPGSPGSADDPPARRRGGRRVYFNADGMTIQRGGTAPTTWSP